MGIELLYHGFDSSSEISLFNNALEQVYHYSITLLSRYLTQNH